MSVAWRLRHPRDWQSLLYLIAYPVLVVALWRGGFSWMLYGLLLFLTLGIGVINHNHHHLRIRKSNTFYCSIVLRKFKSAFF